MLSHLISRLNEFCVRRNMLTITFFILLCGSAAWLSAHHLGITTETDKLFADSLPWKQRNLEIEHLFPNEKDTLVAIIKAKTPEAGQETAHQLAQILKNDHKHFSYIDEPADNIFYKQNAFLFIDKKPLENLLDQTIAAQPFLGPLAADPSARGLFGMFGLMSLGIEHGHSLPDNFNNALEGLSQTLDNASQGKKTSPLSWQMLLASDLSKLAGDYNFVLTYPKRDFSSFEPSEAAITKIRQSLNSLPLIQNGDAQAFITGEAKLSDEEFSTVAQGMVWGLFLSLALVTTWLFFAVRSLRFIIPILLTLIAGLLLTTGFAALAVGTLNLISVAFAILFVGIAVDFAIQYGVRFRSQSLEDNRPLPQYEALLKTGKESGPQIFVAALATSAGFLAFTPTKFIGVAQLGLIAGFGMLIAFFCTLTLLPALLILFKAQPSPQGKGFTPLLPLDRKIRLHRKSIIAIFAVLALVGLFLTPSLSFDSDPLHTKNPHTEGMQALHLLEGNPLTTPYNAQLIVQNAQQAASYAHNFEQLPSVHDVLWLGALVPSEQEEKLALIQDAADILLPSLSPSHIRPQPTASEIREAAKEAAEKLSHIPADKFSPILKKIYLSLERLSHASDERVLQTNIALTAYLPKQIAQLRLALQAHKITESDIPQEIKANYLTSDGHYRLIIHPKGDMSENAVLHRFMKEITKVNPHIAGPALDITASAETITHAFIIAASCAVIAILLILLLVLRRILDSLLVIIPLILSSLLTIILIIELPEQLNFANIIALPLLLGVGVSFNIYFIMNWRAGLKNPLSSPTARAVLFSALTTGSAFGSLAASAHPGTASMGRLLLLSLGCTLLCSLIFIPALLPKRLEDEQ